LAKEESKSNNLPHQRIKRTIVPAPDLRFMWVRLADTSVDPSLWPTPRFSHESYGYRWAVLFHQHLKMQWDKPAIQQLGGERLSLFSYAIVPIPIRLKIGHYRDLCSNDSQQWDFLIRDLV
jgi:hypothetical protein